MVNTVIAQALLTSGRCIVPDFLDAATVQLLRADSQDLQLAKRFIQAGIGKGKTHVKNDQIRKDSISWLDEGGANATQAHLFTKLAALKLALNRELLLGISSFEGHYAFYSAGGFYKRHLDSFRSDDSRIVTVVLYLNDDWKIADGGMLRLYTDPASLDVSPTGGTLACFLSRELEHEVLVSHKSRLTFTGWFKTS